MTTIVRIAALVLLIVVLAHAQDTVTIPGATEPRPIYVKSVDGHAIVYCEHSDADQAHPWAVTKASGCALVNGGTLDDVMTGWLADTKRREDDYEDLRKRYQKTLADDIKMLNGFEKSLTEIQAQAKAMGAAK